MIIDKRKEHGKLIEALNVLDEKKIANLLCMSDTEVHFLILEHVERWPNIKPKDRTDFLKYFIPSRKEKEKCAKVINHKKGDPCLNCIHTECLFSIDFGQLCFESIDGYLD